MANLTDAAERKAREYDFTDGDFERVRKLIYEHAGISLSASKQDMVYSRLARRLRARGVERFADYLTPADLGFIESTLAAGLTPAAKALLLRTGYRAGGLPLEEPSPILAGCSIVDAVPNMAP